MSSFTEALKRFGRGLIIVSFIAFAPRLANAQTTVPLSQVECLRAYAECTADVARAQANGNPILEREAQARLDAFYSDTIVSGRPVHDWCGFLRDMDLDYSGRIVFCAVDVGLGTNFPLIPVTNYDLDSGKIVPGSLDAYRNLSVGDRIRFSGTLRKPIRLADYLKLLPGAELAFGDMNEWGVVATSVGGVVQSPEASRLLDRIDALPERAAALQSLMEECGALKGAIEQRTNSRTLHEWRDVAAEDSEFRDAYDHLVGLPFPEPAPDPSDPYDYIRDPHFNDPIALKPPEVDENVVTKLAAIAGEVKTLLEWRGDAPRDDERVQAFENNSSRLDEETSELELYRSRAQIIYDTQAGIQRPVRLTARGPGEPDRVVIQSILIAFDGSAHPTRMVKRNLFQRLGQDVKKRIRSDLNLRSQSGSAFVSRTEEEASQLASELFERANRGEDFDELLEDYTDDERPSGRYVFANQDIDPGTDEFPRASFPALADSAFRLRVGEVSLVRYDKRKSTWGWHVIKRLQ